MSTAFPAFWYAPAEPARGHAVTVRWAGEQLCIEPTDGAHRWVPASALHLESRGFNAAELGVRWTDDAGLHHLTLGAAQRQAFMDSAPASARAALERAQRQTRRLDRHTRLALGALLLILALPVVVLLVALSQHDRMAGWLAARVPAAVEQHIGEMVLAQTRAEHTLIEHGPAYDALQAIAQRLARPDEKLRFYLADAPDVNAFAAPGGVVVVYTGLIGAADTPEQVAGVLAHEIAHVELRHSLKQIIQSAGLRATIALIVGDLGLFGDLGTTMIELSFSRDAERQADARGLERLQQARIDPSGLPAFFEALLEHEAEGPFPSMLSTHPDTRERIANLRAALQASPPGAGAVMPAVIPAVIPIALDWQAVQRSLP